LLVGLVETVLVGGGLPGYPRGQGSGSESVVAKDVGVRTVSDTLLGAADARRRRRHVQSCRYRRLCSRCIGVMVS
jgi:hypothetical protein